MSNYTQNDTVVTENVPLEFPHLIQGAVPQAKPLLNHRPLTNPRAYYRSKVYSAQTGINPLVVSATTLLSSCAYLRDLSYCDDARTLYQELIHEVKAFEAQAQRLGYRSELILVSRYILCSTLDEMILHSPWGAQSDWQHHKLLNTFHNEDWGGERFFLIAERLSADPHLHVDVLELIYLCLSLGYLGKYRNIENGENLLNHIVDTLYQSIRWQRGDIKKELFIADTTSTTLAVNTAADAFPTWLLMIFSLLFLCTLYIGFDVTLSSATNPIYQQFSQLLQVYE